MKAFKFAALCLVSLLLGGMIYTSTALAAYGAFGAACNSGTGSAKSTTCSNQNQVNNPITGSGSILENVINLVTIATGVIAVIVIVISGIRFTTSSGDPNSVSQARNTILYTVIGLIVLLMARSIIIFVLNRL